MNSYRLDSSGLPINGLNLQTNRSLLFMSLRISYHLDTARTLGEYLTRLDSATRVLTNNSPGRFFAVQVLKMLLGYLLVNYDFEPLTERPKCLEIGEAVIPEEETKVKIRRRQSEPT